MPKEILLDLRKAEEEEDGTEVDSKEEEVEVADFNVEDLKAQEEEANPKAKTTSIVLILRKSNQEMKRSQRRKMNECISFLVFGYVSLI